MGVEASRVGFASNDLLIREVVELLQLPWNKAPIGRK